MARTLKRFETEQEYEDWVNSPQVRTPYTCLVSETGAVHYDEGSDDDYSVTFVMRDDFTMTNRPVVGKNMAPCIVDGERIDYVSGRRARGHDDVGTRIFVNGRELGISELSNNGGYGKCGNYFRKTNIDIKPGDVVKVTFETDTIEDGGFFRTAGYWVKEIIIGDGITYIGRRAFSFKENYNVEIDNVCKHDNLIKISIGKNVSYLGEACFRFVDARFQFNLCRKNVLVSNTFHSGDSIYNRLTDSSKEFYDEDYTKRN